MVADLSRRPCRTLFNLLLFFSNVPLLIECILVPSIFLFLLYLLSLLFDLFPPFFFLSFFLFFFFFQSFTFPVRLDFQSRCTCVEDTRYTPRQNSTDTRCLGWRSFLAFTSLDRIPVFVSLFSIAQLLASSFFFFFSLPLFSFLLSVSSSFLIAGIEDDLRDRISVGKLNNDNNDNIDRGIIVRCLTRLGLVFFMGV